MFEKIQDAILLLLGIFAVLAVASENIGTVTNWFQLFSN